MQDKDITRQRSKVRGFALYVPPSARRGITNEDKKQQETEGGSNKTVKQVCIEIPGQKPSERRAINTELELQFSPSNLAKTKNEKNHRTSDENTTLDVPEIFEETKPVLPQPKVREVFKGAYVPPGRRAQNIEIPTQVIKSNPLIEEKVPKVLKNVVASIPDATDGNNDATIDIKRLEISNIVDKETKTIVAKTSSDAPRGSYIPPWQRAAIAEEKRLDAEAEASGIKRIVVVKVVPSTQVIPSVQITQSLHKRCEGIGSLYVPPIINDEEIYQEEYSVQKCSFVVTGLPPDLPEYSKDRFLQPFVDKGALVNWISSIEAIIVFPTEILAKTALAIQKSSFLKVVSLQDIEDAETERFLTVSTEMYNTLRPERDCRVANRMIGAALGVRLPKRMTQDATKLRSKSPKKEDAWDD
mmetsp:Transcript_27782/g.26594  ORF Transcript_27782/g.26594 Transcript_27782/m.26594 type:complete len:414 (-) Transcript_27782:192-1433(-)|eukprot:CAMPEP_0119046308 /NCGR_PEP_ID=MMETSP1177-20130426/45707_1 /TAXON_ID=2985 /ORGANISM="Ochromonas sp, Strain CCMP1899" /LENGTH=413 /DNA_ID=CAMNT_0007019267 /DNA_START=33 /DNA_END=1274 /DNA_ORIENTATION=+